MPVEDLLNHVPAEAVYRRVPLPPGENAWPLWEQAMDGMEAVAAQMEPWTTVVSPDDETEEYAPWPADQEDAIRDFLAREQWRLDRFQEGLDRGKAQVPVPEPDGELGPTLGLRTMIRLAWLSARSHVTDGQTDDAMGICLGLLRAGDMLAAGEGMLVDWILGGVAIHGAACHRIDWLLENAELDREPLCRAVSALRAEPPFEDGLATSLKVDLVYELGTLDRLPDQAEASVVAEALFEGYSCRTELVDCEFIEVPDSDPRRQWIREKTHFLLDDHPRPLDKFATARILGEVYAEMVRACGELEHKPAEEVTEALKASPLNEKIRGNAEPWPNVLFPMFSLQAIGDTEEATQYRNSMTELSDDPEMRDRMREFYRIPSDEDFAAARRKLLGMENPVGWWFAHATAPVLGPCLESVSREYERREELAERIARRLD
jgi:hypothetical protein